MKKTVQKCFVFLRKCPTGFSLVLLTCLGLMGTLYAQRGVHPSIPFTQYDLNQLKANITQEPWLSAYTVFANDYRSKLSYGQQGPFVNVSRAPNLNNNAWKNDMVAVHNLAFMYVFTGDSAYARKATNLIDAWATTNTVWGGTESMLDIGDYADFWATGADILRGTFPNWTADNTQHVKDYFANVLYPTSYVPYPTRDANKGALQMKIALGAAAFNDDATKFNEALDVYRMDAGGGLRNSLTNGEVGDAGRDDHWRVQVAALVWGAEVAFKQGVDMYAELGDRVLAIGELYHQYAFVGNTLTYIPMGGYSSFWLNWGIQPGNRVGDYTNTFKAAYSLRKGIATPYTDMMRSALMVTGTTYYSPAGGNFLFLKTSDTSTAVPLAPVFYPADNAQPVSLLTNLDIGNPGVAGSAAYDNGSGTWTLKGAGNSLSTSMNYTFKKMKGEAGLVAKVTGMSLTTGGAGLMIRQSLASGATYWNVQLGATGGVGAHLPPKAPWWLKIERVGKRIFTYHSPDGINWTGSACTYTPAGYSDSLFYGLYAISNNTSAANTVTFTNVAFSQALATGAPEFTSAASADGVINTAFTYNTVATNSPTSFTASGLPAGLVFDNTTGVISGTPTALGTSTVTLTATNASGTSTHILVIRITNDAAPAAPAGPTATVVNTSQIRLNWTASANATSYAVKRSLTTGGPYTTIATDITGTTYTDISPTPEVPNYYVITALSGSLESSASSQVSASVPPAIPGKPVITLSSNQLKLDWTPASGANTYSIKRSNVTGGPYTTIANVSGTTYTDASVVTGNSYYYVISSVGNTLQSGNSPEAYGVPGANIYTWAPSPLTENWSNPGNWVENAVPTSPAIIIFKNTDDSTSINDISNLNVSRILFDTTANSYTISGNQLTMSNDLVNSSSAAQFVSTPLVLSNNLTVNANTQNVTLSGIITGTGTFTRIGVNNVYVTGNNTYSGNTVISGAAGGWAPTNGLVIAGTGIGTPSIPTSGPLGTGKVILNGGALWSEGGDAILYNDLEAATGKTSRIFQTTNAVYLYGKLMGNGEIRQDGNTFAGLHLYGDNSGYSGYFVCVLRSGNNRLRFASPQSGSASASWNLDATGVDCQSINFLSGTISFGALAGRGYFRCNTTSGAPVMSIGALNISTSFGGTINNAAGTIGVEKVGTANLAFTGNHTYTGATIVRSGKFLLNNDASVGTFNSPVTAIAGAFGGTGRTTAAITIGTGSGTGAALEPGNLSVGTVLTTSSLTLLQDATYNVEINASNATADKIQAASVALTNAQLNTAITVTGTIPSGTNFTIIDNTGTGAITGTFSGLPELALVTVGGYNFRITYKGGTGNDVVLLDDRTVPITIISPSTANGLVGINFNYTISATNSPYSFNATSLPAGLTVNTTTGVISGTPTTIGTYTVPVSATSTSGTASINLVINVYSSNAVTGAFAAGGDNRVTVECDATPAADTFLIKRSTTSGGPYTVIAKSLTNRYIDLTAVNGTRYYYIVSALTGNYEGTSSSQTVANPNTSQVDYFNFDETSGTKSVDYWGANHATLMSAATRATGKYGQALKLDGTTNSYATVPAGIASNLSTFTIAFWLNAATLTNWARAFDFGNAGTTKFLYFAPRTATAGRVRYGIRNGGTEQTLDAVYTFVTNTWTHVAITYASNTLNIYINGTLVGTSTSISIKPSDIGSTANNNLGKATGTDPNFTGSIDEFRIYNRAFNATEVSALYGTIILPVTLTSYTATLQNSGAVVLNWKTATEVNNSHYTIERSADGRNFTEISGRVAAKNVNNAAYTFTDNNPVQGNNYYQLKQVDKDGKTTDLGIRLVKVDVKAEHRWVVYPNPVKGTLYLKAVDGSISSGSITVKLVNTAGITVLSKKVGYTPGALLAIDLGAGVPAGNYNLLVDEKESLAVVIVR